MPGEIKLLVDDLELIESPMPGIGSPVKVVASNTGTTKLLTVSIYTRGEGAGNVEMSLDGETWQFALELDGLEPGKTKDFWVRPMYSPDDAEDRQTFQLRASAMSLGSSI